jgi:hypothetical protein
MSLEKCGVSYEGLADLKCDLPRGHAGFHSGSAVLYPEHSAMATRHAWGDSVLANELRSMRVQDVHA